MTDGVDVRLFRPERPDNSPFVEHNQPVAERKQLLQILGDKQDPRALVPCPKKGLPGHNGAPNVQAACEIRSDDQPGTGGQFPENHHALEIPAGEGPGRYVQRERESEPFHCILDIPVNGLPVHSQPTRAGVVPGSGQHEILQNGHKGHDGHAQRVLRNEPDPTPTNQPDGGTGHILSEEDFPPPDARDHSQDYVSQFPLPVAGNSSHPDNLARIDLKVNSPERCLSPGGPRLNPAQFQQGRSVFSPRFLPVHSGTGQLLPEHQGDQFFLSGFWTQERASDPPAAQDGDAVGTRQHFFHLVGDQ